MQEVALVAMSLQGIDTVHKVSYKIMVLLGGWAAEKRVFGHLSTGAADDLAKVTDMATRYGMVESLGSSPTRPSASRACCPVAGSPARTRSRTLTRPCGRS